MIQWVVPDSTFSLAAGGWLHVSPILLFPVCTTGSNVTCSWLLFECKAQSNKVLTNNLQGELLDQAGSSAHLCLRSSNTLHPTAHPCMTTLKTNLFYFSGQLFDQMGSLCWQYTVKLLVEGFAWGWEGDIALAILLTNVLQWSKQHDLGDQLTQGCPGSLMCKRRSAGQWETFFELFPVCRLYHFRTVRTKNTKGEKKNSLFIAYCLVESDLWNEASCPPSAQNKYRQCFEITTVLCYFQ